MGIGNIYMYLVFMIYLFEPILTLSRFHALANTTPVQLHKIIVQDSFTSLHFPGSFTTETNVQSVNIVLVII